MSGTVARKASFTKVAQDCGQSVLELHRGVDLRKFAGDIRNTESFGCCSELFLSKR